MFISKLMPRPRRGSFVADTDGTAALEFAIIFPVVMLLMLGAIEMSRAVVMARRFNLLAATISDLVARDPMETDASFVGLQRVAETIWAPYEKTSLVLQVLNVRKSSTTTTKMAKSTDYVDWSKNMPIDSAAAPATNFTSCAPYAGLPTNMLAPGSSTVIVNASYKFKTLFGLSVPGLGTGQNWVSLSAHTPRNMCVYYNAPNCVPQCE
jgi:Flp pilus assembly protein TadG